MPERAQDLNESALALAGAAVGIDRGYIRKWFDMQDYLHDEDDIKLRKQQHAIGVERLKEAYKAEGFGLTSRTDTQPVLDQQAAGTQPISPRTLQPAEQPAAPQLEKQREVRVLKEGNDNNKPSPRLQANNDNEREVQALQDSKAIVSL